jgi:hypothetical protein
MLSRFALWRAMCRICAQARNVGSGNQVPSSASFDSVVPLPHIKSSESSDESDDERAHADLNANARLTERERDDGAHLEP